MTPTGMRMVMLIDDEPAQQRLVSALAARAGWRTIFAADSETAIAHLGTRDGMMLDAVLIDHSMSNDEADRSCPTFGDWPVHIVSQACRTGDQRSRVTSHFIHSS